MKYRIVRGVLAGTIAAFALSWLIVISAPAEERKDTETKKIRAEERTAPEDALRALTAFNAAPTAGRGEPLPQTIETPYTSAYKVVHLEFRDTDACERFKVDGAHVFSRFGRFADVFVDADKGLGDVLFKDPKAGIVWFDFATLAIAPPPPPAREDKERARALEEVVRGGVGDLTGKGVIVAVLDTGIDFHHPDFVTYDGDGKPTSRLLYFWDTANDAYADNVGSKAPLRYPNGASIGTIYSRDDLTRELRSGKPRIHVWDLDGHGTACASIAAGNGNAMEKQRYAGVAPQAELIAVRLQDRGPGLENFYLLNAICGWVDEVAKKEGKPAVLSCSFGGHSGGHDGYCIEERQLNARFPATIQGRALCIAAGNEGADRIHAAVTFGPEDKGTLKWDSFRGGILDVYTDADATADVQVEGVGEKTAIKYIHGLTAKLVLRVSVQPGRGELRLVSKSGKKHSADAYIKTTHDPKDGFDDSCRVSGKQIGTPATSAQAITVGSYDFSNNFELQGKPVFMMAEDRQGVRIRMTLGALSSYSNPGPSRLGDVVKPEVVAPGQYWTASAAMNTRALRDTSGRYRLFNGTSAATPYTAGIVALLMQKKPTITLGEIKELIRNHADKEDDHVSRSGKAPSPDWGYGKLNRKAVAAMLEAIR
jgi:subtilisin family serine protease